MGHESFEQEVVVNGVSLAELAGVARAEPQAAGVAHVEPWGTEPRGAGRAHREPEGSVEVGTVISWAMRQGRGASATEVTLTSVDGLAGGKRTLRAIQGLLAALDPAELVASDVDVKKVVTFVASIAWRDMILERRMRFYRRGGERVGDLLPVNRLPRLARAAWYAWQSQLSSEVVVPGPAVSAEDLNLAIGVRARMLTVLRRNYGGRDDEVALAVRRLHLKVRYLDVIGTHLLTLTELYGRDDVRRVIEQDKMYLSGDADEALRLAGALLIARGIDRRAKVERKRDRTRRAVTLLIKVYETHARYGRSIFAGREDVAMTYPPIESDGWPVSLPPHRW